MPLAELELAALRQYRPTLSAPADFDDFWSATLEEARASAVDPMLTPVDAHLRTLEVYDLTFSGFGGEPVRAWLLRPAGAAGSLPAVVTYRGYGGGRGAPVEHVGWAAAGFAHLVMDTRGQGSGWSAGATADPHGSGPAYPGVMTRGIEHQDHYYYRRLMTDAARLAEVARSLRGIDPEKVVVAGESQGGGLALAAAGLVDGVAAALIDVPFLCHFERAMDIASEGPYLELTSYLGAHHGGDDHVLRTLAYFDGVHHASRMTAPASFSVALMDTICPPSTVFAAYRSAASSAKRMSVYRYNGHEGGRPDQWAMHATFLEDLGIAAA
jgi:cephalosporin-C deacetylase